jgi:hypothetical protein
MTDNLEDRLRDRLRNASLPRAPETLHGYLADLPTDAQPGTGHMSWRSSTMNLLTRLAAAAVIVVIVGGGAIYLIQRGQPGVGTQSPAPGSQTQTIHLQEHPTSGAGVKVGQYQAGSIAVCTATAASCIGDSIIGYDPVVDVATGKEVGFVAYECFLLDTARSLFHCPGITVDLTGRGQIVYTNFLYGGAARQATSPITGGTGEFLGATGTVTVQQLPGPVGDYVISFSK